MGLVHAELELVNQQDISDADQHLIGEDEMRCMRVRALVDSGAEYLCINEYIQEVLQVPVIETRKIELADGTRALLQFAGPITMRIAGHSVKCDAVVLPGGSEPLLGVRPLEDLNVVIDLKRNQLLMNFDYLQ